ncbi:hypothetical protein LTR99_007611 [Exophiala xenobiotica]|uniref:Uncharacterized protein n=1 Tax=Vermiconidia calcicola TaxID=1690605 RepID=A0AAV9Q351_9PEZI|nr:hypothetical protein LTR96_005669 [Exophiala xenobiotica]KAK5532716.1 hypothetical protein LTR23_009426 [Chaetothyriales sp. CCFEE 6169]KAK5534720.1 hypothetical protein LTR25_006752 [Vermiconidia calcicola]KAK5299343.1 hypothetical protein LTR99_007611 [Exophiala xenobiotica]KAK5337226.1 hypothetical protein LTR98_006341 [Exophiala xenobiotica]
MASQSDHGPGPSEYLSGPEQHRRLDLSANEPTFHTAPDHEPGFVLTLTDPEFAEFLMQRLQLAVAKDVRVSPTLRSCLEDIDKHDILNKIDIEVSYVSSSQDGVGIPETCRCKFSLSIHSTSYPDFLSRGGIFWNVTVTDVPSNLTELDADDGQTSAKTEQLIYSEKTSTKLQQYLED